MTKTIVFALLVALSLNALGADITYTNERGYSAILHEETLGTFMIGDKRLAIGTITQQTPSGSVRVKYLVTCLPCSAGWLCGGDRYTVVDGYKGDPKPWITNGGTIGDDIAYDVCYHAVQKQLTTGEAR